jgi:hypothetical protein
MSASIAGVAKDRPIHDTEHQRQRIRIACQQESQRGSLCHAPPTARRW